MTPERWNKLDALFHEALELQGEARAIHLAKVCGDDEQLREEAERLIAAHEREGSFIDSPIFAEPEGLMPAGLTPAGLTPAGLTPAGRPPAGRTPAGLTPAGLTPAGLTNDEDNESTVGRRIGPYQVISLLGQGGMGKVYLAEDMRLERKVALKVLPDSFTQNPDRVRRFEREAKA